MCYNIKFKNFTVHASNRCMNKTLFLDGNTPSEETLKTFEKVLEGFQVSKKGFSFYDTLENRMKLKTLDRDFVPVMDVKIERELNKYIQSDTKQAILKSLVSNQIYTGFIRYENDLFVIYKSAASKSKIAVADENLSVIHYYKNGKVTKTECLDLLPF